MKKIDGCWEIVLGAKQFLRSPHVDKMEDQVDKNVQLGKILVEVKNRIQKIRRFALEDADDA